MDTNRETILDELNDFDKKRPSDISTILESYLNRIAKTGDPMFPWNKLKPLIRRKMEIVISEFHEVCPTDTLPSLPNVDLFKYDDLKCKILEAVDSFPNAPFTIQRLCELLTSPKKHYKRTDKFMRGLEKNILVVSTVEPRSADHSEVNNNNNLIMNGILESSAVADMLSNENVNLSSRTVINGTPPPPPPDNYPHAAFSPDAGSIDGAADSESSSSSDSDSSSDSLPPDYVKDSQMESIVNGTAGIQALQAETAMDTSQDLLDQSDTEQVVSSSSLSNELKEEEKGVLSEERMNSEDISTFTADSTDCQPSILKPEGGSDSKSSEEEIPESSECSEEMASTSVAAKEEESVSETQGNESPTKMLLIEEVAVSLSEVLDATPLQDDFVTGCVQDAKVECSSECDLQPQEHVKAVEIEMTAEIQTDNLEKIVKCDKSEPMEED